MFEAEWLDGASGPTLGAKFRGHVRRNEIGPVYWTTCRVTACEPGKEFGFAVLGPGDQAINNWHYRLTPRGDGTDVTESFRLNNPTGEGVLDVRRLSAGTAQRPGHAHHSAAHQGSGRSRELNPTAYCGGTAALRQFGAGRGWRAHMGIATRVNGEAPPDVPLADIDLSDPEFWALDDAIRDGAFATLRREAPIKFFHELEFEGFEHGPGHWALMKFDDVHFASRHPEIFSSYPNITIADQMPEVAEYFGSMIALDDPRHARLRGIVRSAFTPKWWREPKSPCETGPGD